jgi:uncharacterized protein YeaO (DUF488 family)
MGQQAASPAASPVCVRRYTAEMNEPAAKHNFTLLSALSHSTNFSVGCYSEDEERCHRSVLRALLRERGAKMA